MWPALIPLIGDLIGRLFPDPEKAAEAKMKLLEMQQNGQLAELDADLKLALAQLEVNKVEAASSSLLVSGGRPFILWGCGLAMLYVSLLEPLMRFVAVVAFHYTGAFPAIDTTLTTQVLLGLLGLSGMRMAEKFKGVARDKL